MLDFPNSPTTGQIFNAIGKSWTWDGVKWASNAAGGAFLPLTGGTVTGPLTVNGATNLNSLNVAATATFAATASFASTMNVTGATTFQLGALFGPNPASLAVNSGNVLTTGPGSMLLAYDRGNSGGTTTNGFGHYRDANIGRLWMPEFGDLMQFGTGGTVTAMSAFAVNGTLYPYGLLYSNTTNMHYPIQIRTTAGYNGSLYWVPGSDHQWFCGPMATVAANTFYIYNNSSGGARVNITATQGLMYGTTYAAYTGGYLTVGANGIWEGTGSTVFSPNSGGSACLTVYGGSVGGGWAIYSRVDVFTNYNMLVVYGGTACGSVTSNGSNAFFNTTCDARRKNNIRPLVSDIDVGGIIDALKPVAFEWKPYEFETLDEPATENRDIEGRDLGKPAIKGKLMRVEVRTDHGFVAQDLYEVLPGIVHKPESDEELMQADYSKMMPYVIAELQALRKRVAELEAR